VEEYYRTLGLPSGASQSEIKKAFRRLAMQYHPDRNPAPDAAAKFHDINIAYEILIGERKPPIYKRVNPFKQRPTAG
jgi:molecular chaperone DnaJ